MPVPVTLDGSEVNAFTAYDEAHNLYVTVFSQIDDTTGQHIIFYAVNGSYQNFDPANVEAIQVRVANPDGSLSDLANVCGIPRSITIHSGTIEVHITNLSGEVSTEANRRPGELLLGTYRSDANPTTFQWIKWAIVSANIGEFRNPQPTLTVSDQDSNNPVYPSGVTCVEYEKAGNGIVTDSKGAPKIAKIDDSLGDVDGNYKVGQLVLNFHQDFFGVGKHAWLGNPSTAFKPFDIFLVPTTLNGNTTYKLYLWPGTINQLIPTGMFTQVDYDPNSTVYVKVHATSNGTKITTASIVIDTTPPIVNAINASSGASTLDVLIGLVVKKNIYKTWGGGNIRATLSPDLIQERAAPIPGSSPYIYWWAWKIEVES